MSALSTLTEYRDVEQRTDKWYELRLGIVTASVAGQLLTPTGKVAANDASRGLAASLAAERITGHVEPTYTTWDMERGILDEPRARAVYAEHFGEVTECGFMVRHGWETDDGNLFCIGLSPDGLVGDDGLIEIKSRNQKKQVQTVLSGAIPPENFVQCQTALLVSGRKWLDYVSYSGGMHMWVTRIEPDPYWIDAIVAAVGACEDAIQRYEAVYTEAVAKFPMTERPVELVI